MRALFQRIGLLSLLLASLPLCGAAAAEESVTDRLQALEAEHQALRSELQWLRNNPVRLPAVTATPASMASASYAPQTHQQTYYTMQELRAEMKRHAWRKGNFSIVPYGFLWANMVYETERSNSGDYTLWVLSADDEGEDAFHVNARSTRLGINVAGPRLRCFGCAKSGGKVEIDFHGNFAVENKPGVLLRHAYWEVKDDTFRFVAGQTWDVIAPLNPGTIMYSVYWGGGNIGYRRAQFRAERYVRLTDSTLLTLQGSLNTDAGTDIGRTSPNTGDHAGWPMLEGRVALTLANCNPCVKPITVGVSGHIGEQIFDFVGADDTARRTWSGNIDLRVPITKRLGFQGEIYTGENLATFLGGIVQGVDIGTERAIRDNGGWMEIWYKLSPRLHTHWGYGLDDPEDADLSDATDRTYNQFYFGNIVYDATDKLTVGFEVSSWKTLYLGQRPGEDVRFEFMAKYGF